ncbi:MAG TPA: hypothetical protein VFV38_13580 [Ktedonobacteraceae bacterium]|nr:hypothetical protein [Ktedonobacteraceae bacterium]
MPHPSVTLYDEACQIVAQLGILPLSGSIPDHPSLDSITQPSAWHTSLETDPWRWRNRFATEGVAAYGRFIGSKPFLVAREIFPLVKRLLTGSTTVEERYAAGTLARSTLQLYQIIQEHDIIDVRALRKQAGMQNKTDKNAFDRALIDLQNAAEIVMSGTTSPKNDQGSGWDGTCYMLAEHWMVQHNIPTLSLTPAEARTQLFSWLKPRWEESALLYLQKKLA